MQIGNWVEMRQYCLVLSPVVFTPLTRTRQDSFVLSVSAMWTTHNSAILYTVIFISSNSTAIVKSGLNNSEYRLQLKWVLKQDRISFVVDCCGVAANHIEVILITCLMTSCSVIIVVIKTKNKLWRLRPKKLKISGVDSRYRGFRRFNEPGPPSSWGPRAPSHKNFIQWPDLLMTTIWYFTSLATWKSNFTKDRLHENVCKKMPPDRLKMH